MEVVKKAIGILQGIPEIDFIAGDWDHGDKHCSMGHLNLAFGSEVSYRNTKETNLINSMIETKFNYSIVSINDYSRATPFKQSTPKGRVIAALQSLLITKKYGYFVRVKDWFMRLF